MNVLIDFIKKIQTEKRIQILNEEATKQSVILPMLQLLGWQVFDPDEVFPEFSIENTRVDYALRNGIISKVFIEVKRKNEDLDKHQEQLLTYSFRQGVNLSILTNGILWWFYLPLQEGSWEQRKFYAIDMYSQNFEKIAEVLTNFLAKEKVFNGDALKNAKKIYSNRQKVDILKKNIPKAWRKLHVEGDEILIELIAETTEKICGYKPDDKDISEFLYSMMDNKMTNTPQKKIKTKNITKSFTEIISNNHIGSNMELYSLNDNFTFKKISGFIFLNTNTDITSWRQFLLKFIGIIANLHINDFYKIDIVSGKHKTYFSKNPNKFNNPAKILNTEYFIETNLSANNIVSVVKSVLITFNYEISDLKIRLRN